MTERVADKTRVLINKPSEDELSNPTQSPIVKTHPRPLDRYFDGSLIPAIKEGALN